MTNPYPTLIFLCLLIAVYMFAALKFPALRFIFRLKRGAARVAGADDDANRRIGESLGMVLCPIIGVGALLVAGWLMLQWRQDGVSTDHREAMGRESKSRRESQVDTVTKEWAVMEATYGGYRKFGATADGLSKLQNFVSSIGEQFSSDCVPINAKTMQFRRDRDAWRVQLGPEDDAQGQAVLMLRPEREEILIGISLTADRPPTRGFELIVPEGVREAWGTLRDLEKVDLQALKQEQQRKRSQEDRRLADYKEQTFEGMPAYQVYEAVMAVPENQRNNTKAEFVGMEIDWEVQLGLIEEKDEALVVRADQSRPDPGKSWSVFFEVKRDVLPDLDRLPRFEFARIKGVVESLDKGIRVKVDSLERFKP